MSAPDLDPEDESPPLDPEEAPPDLEPEDEPPDLVPPDLEPEEEPLEPSLLPLLKTAVSVSKSMLGASEGDVSRRPSMRWSRGGGVGESDEGRSSSCPSWCQFRPRSVWPG